MSIQVMLLQLGKGMIVSVEIFILTLLFSLPLGLVISFGRMSKNFALRAITKFYISVMRGTPLMLQLLVAYFAEIYRSGIESMPVGQYEAAKVLGYNKLQTFFKIILPQVIKRILPSVTNEIITLVKDTSLAFAIAQAEMFTIAKQIAASQTSVMPLMVAGVYYYIFNLIVAVAMEKVEKAFSYYR